MNSDHSPPGQPARSHFPTRREKGLRPPKSAAATTAAIWLRVLLNSQSGPHEQVRENFPPKKKPSQLQIAFYLDRRRGANDR